MENDQTVKRKVPIEELETMLKSLPKNEFGDDQSFEMLGEAAYVPSYLSGGVAETHGQLESNTRRDKPFS